MTIQMFEPKPMVSAAPPRAAAPGVPITTPTTIDVSALSIAQPVEEAKMQAVQEMAKASIASDLKNNPYVWAVGGVLAGKFLGLWGGAAAVVGAAFLANQWGE